jgi:hypothetical protein
MAIKPNAEENFRGSQYVVLHSTNKQGLTLRKTHIFKYLITCHHFAATTRLFFALSRLRPVAARQDKRTSRRHLWWHNGYDKLQEGRPAGSKLEIKIVCSHTISTVTSGLLSLSLRKGRMKLNRSPALCRLHTRVRVPAMSWSNLQRIIQNMKSTEAVKKKVLLGGDRAFMEIREVTVTWFIKESASYVSKSRTHKTGTENNAVLNRLSRV